MAYHHDVERRMTHRWTAGHKLPPADREPDFPDNEYHRARLRLPPASPEDLFPLEVRRPQCPRPLTEAEMWATAGIAIVAMIGALLTWLVMR